MEDNVYLKPCPFCACDLIKLVVNTATMVTCGQCEASVIRNHHDEAVGAWNGRSWRGNWSLPPFLSGWLMGHARGKDLTEEQVLVQALRIYRLHEDGKFDETSEVSEIRKNLE